MTAGGGIRRYLVAPQDAVSLLTGKARVAGRPLPEDAAFVSGYFDPDRGLLSLTVYSRTFDPAPAELAPIPHPSPIVEQAK